MTICIPYSARGLGGPYTFVREFTKFLEESGHRVTTTPDRSYDVLFVIERCPLRFAKRAQREERSIIHRMDGVYHRGIPGRDGYLATLKNYRPKRLHNTLANHVVYQSHFSRRACTQMLGQRPHNWSVIYNGVRTTHAYDRPVDQTHQKLQLVTVASFRRLDQLMPLLETCRLLAIPYDLHIVGPTKPPLAALIDRFSDIKTLQYHGPRPHDKLQKILSKSDIFLFSDQSACPHSVLEALAVGLPVVAFDRGSMRELITPGVSGEIVPLPSHDPFRISYPFSTDSYHSLAQAIEHIANQLPEYQQGAIQEAKNRFSYQAMAQQYLTLFEKGL